MGAEALNSSRAEVMQRIRRALGRPQTNAPQADSAAIAAEWQAIPRDYIRSAALSRESIVDLLEDRLRDYDATVVRVPPADIPAQIATFLNARGKQRLVIPAGLAESLGAPLPAGFEFIEDSNLSADQLDAVDGVVTASTLAVAATGTIVLQAVPGQGRRAPTLVPDYHLCVVRVTDIVETIPEAMARLEATSALATTMISGPSATADIEMTRIKGVHGPRFLDVILAG
jgi:L-lactate dehydrogenase complex protein LldG